MKEAVVAIWDGAVQAYNRPFTAPSVGAAIRGFVDEVNREDPANVMCKHPEDFELRHMADWDPESGKFFEPEGGTARVLVRAKDVRN